jgi:hemerythrin-like domain-containing protein
MREHGILRRTLIVYSEMIPRLRQKTKIDIPAIHKAAQLFRSFGEEYHERKLEEGYIFPAAQKIGGPIAALAQILLTQHNRGREITDYILRFTEQKIQSESLADVLEGFVRMYRSHAAREDTILFPAWKKTMNATQLHEIAEKFEDIEHEQFGKDGFDDAVKQIASIEENLGLGDLNSFTAPVPPRI